MLDLFGNCQHKEEGWQLFLLDNPSKELRRHRRKLRAIPAWANSVKISRVYDKCKTMRSSGFDVVVDHIVPLSSELVCGLHCEDNLEVITYKRNEAKSNHWWPDMPNENLDLFGVHEFEQYELRL